MKRTIYKHFCGGVDLVECKEIINEMYTMNVHSILDYSVEGQKMNCHLTSHVKRKLILLIQFQKIKPLNLFLNLPALGRYDLFKMVSSENQLNKTENDEWFNVVARFHKICKHAMKMNIKILIDAEEYEVQKAIDDLSLEMMINYNINDVIVYNTIQLYRWDRLDCLKKILKKYSASEFNFDLN